MATVQHANFIEYGRRGPRRQKTENAYSEDLFGKNIKRVRPSDIKVIQRSEYERIYASLNAKDTKKEEKENRNKEKQRLKDLSKNQVGKWSNTLEGQRLAKLEAKEKREVIEEELRKKEDIDEAIYQAEQRQIAIEHAKTITFAHTDRVKDFHGALILTEVLKEREAQIELMRRRQESARIKEEKRIEQFKQRMKELAIEEHNAAARRLQKTKEVQQYQIAQVEANQKKAKDELSNWRKEGQELRRMTKENLEIEQNDQNSKRDNAKAEMRQSFHDHLRASKALQQLEKKRASEEAAEMQIFANHKRRLARLRNEKHDQERVRKNRMRTMLLEKLDQQVAADNTEYEERLQKRKEELENYERDLEAAKEERRQQEVREMVNHRKMQTELNQQARQRQLEQERIEVRQKMEDDRNWGKYLVEKEKKRRDIAVDFKNNHFKLINEKATNERNESELNLACDQTINELNKLEEEQFQKYTKDVIEEAVDKGRNPYPLRKAAEGGTGGGRGPQFSGIGGLRPSYMACDQSGVQMPNYAQRKSTLKIKGALNADCARVGKKRLGFVWQNEGQE